MESPASWLLITACLAVSDLHETQRTWAFLVAAGVVADEPGHRERFAEAALSEVDRDITGPSAAWRVAARLASLRALRAEASRPDPWATIAKAWRDRFDRGQPVHAQLE
jgi:hypothetical protein